MAIGEGTLPNDLAQVVDPVSLSGGLPGGEVMENAPGPQERVGRTIAWEEGLSHDLAPVVEVVDVTDRAAEGSQISDGIG
jgi:hypothetical protein